MTTTVFEQRKRDLTHQTRKVGTVVVLDEGHVQGYRH
jgi:hypothetical protein